MESVKKARNIDYDKFVQYSIQKWAKWIHRFKIGEYKYYTAKGKKKNAKRVNSLHAGRTLLSSLKGSAIPNKTNPDRLEYKYLFRGVWVELGVYKGVKKEKAGENNPRKPKHWRHRTLYSDVKGMKTLLEKKYGADGIYMIKQIIEQ